MVVPGPPTPAPHRRLCCGTISNCLPTPTPFLAHLPANLYHREVGWGGGILLNSGQPHSLSASSSSKSVNFSSEPPHVQWFRCLFFANHMYKQKCLPRPKYPTLSCLTVMFLSKQHVMLCLSNSSHMVGTIPFLIIISHERLSDGREEGQLNTTSPGWQFRPADESPVLETGTPSILSIL